MADMTRLITDLGTRSRTPARADALPRTTQVLARCLHALRLAAARACATRRCPGTAERGQLLSCAVAALHKHGRSQ